MMHSPWIAALARDIVARQDPHEPALSFEAWKVLDGEPDGLYQQALEAGFTGCA